MHLGYHGGLCCGIKTVRGFEYNPSSVMPAQNYPKPNGWGKDAIGGQVKSDESFFYGKCPPETAEARLDRFIAFMHMHRHNNVLEAVIVPYYGVDEDDDDEDGTTSYQKKWVPVLEKKGFKMVTEALNSNSHNVIQIWHLVITPENAPDKPAQASPNPFR